ncbi:MAG: MFS transporter [Ilumatobacteraceae bacterium]
MSTSAWAPLRSTAFRAMFVAQLVSNLGTLMHNVGAAWLMGDVGGSSALVALVQATTFVPVLLVGVPAGALADLFDRRRLLIATQVAMLAVASLLAVLTFSDRVTPLSLLALTFAMGTGAAVMSPAWFAIQPDLVSKEQFPQAVSLSALTFNVGRAVGPAIGGALIASAGTGWVFALNGASFVGTMAALVWWRAPRRADDGLPKERLAAASVTGLRYGLHSTPVRITMIRGAVLTGGACSITALLPVVVRGPLGWSPGGFGLLLGCFGAGSSIAAVIRPRVSKHLDADRVMSIGALTMAGTLVIQGLVHDRIVIGVGLFAGGMAWSLTTTEVTVAAQCAVPAWVRARGVGLVMLVITGAFAVGSALWGVLAAVDLRIAHLAPALILLLSPLLGRRWRVAAAQTVDLTAVPGDTTLVVLQPGHDRGPVRVSYDYRVAPDEVDDFVAAMDQIRRHRRRTGGYGWTLDRDMDDPTRFTETFLVATWADRLRQGQRRTAASDEWIRRVEPWLTGSGPRHHLAIIGRGAPPLRQVLRADDTSRVVDAGVGTIV